jgi:titin
MKHFALITASIVSALFLSAGLFKSPSTFIVNSMADSSDANIGNGVCETSTPGECTFRAAIEEANANSGVDTINFNIPGSGPYTISPSYSFDFITDPVIIDGTTQPGFAGTPIIELDGSNAGPDAYGIVIFAGSSKVSGLVINRFNLTGLDIDVNGGNIIQGNYIGTDITGTIDLGNGVNGIAISQGSSNNKIGGTAPGMRNIISGNGQVGIIIVDSGSTGNVIKGNYIGTDVTGTIDLGNSSTGVVIGLGASDNVVGGTEVGSRNLISGNDSAGVQIAETGSTGNIVQGNYIGTDVTGTLALGNVYEGVFIAGGATNNIVGGNEAGAGNLISGNNGNGITIADTGTTGNLIQGNYIGTDATGTLSLGNTAEGVVIYIAASGNTVGGTMPKTRNIISGNASNGVTIGVSASDNLVQGNYIGTDVNGNAPLGNLGNGVVIAGAASNNTIGGMTSEAGNIIAYNTSNGVLLTADAGTGNVISSNSIFSNVELGIDLGEDGVTLNDLFDSDSGPNNLQNFPVITAAKPNGTATSVNVKLSSTPNTTFRIELFNTTVCGPSGYGEGNTFLSFVDVTTNAAGQANVKISLTMSLPVGSFLTTTATDPDGNTSEFSKCKIVNQSQ